MSRYRSVNVGSKIIDIPDDDTIDDWDEALRIVAKAWGVDEIVEATLDCSDGYADQYNCTYRSGRFYGNGSFTCLR